MVTSPSVSLCVIHCMPCIVTDYKPQLFKCQTKINADVSDPVPMAAVVGVTLSLLIIFLLLVITLLVAYKKEKLCFKGKNLDQTITL